MKKAFLLLALVVVACSKPQGNSDKVIQAIQEYVKNNFDNPTSYENIQYSKLDSAYEYPDTLDIQIEDLREAVLIERQADSVKQAIQAQLNEMGVPLKKDTTAKDFNEQAVQYQKKLDVLLASPKQKHYYMSDKHRAKNKLGVVEINTINYELDTTFKIIDTN